MPSPTNLLQPSPASPCLCLALCLVVPSPVRPRYPRYGCGCVDALIGLMQGKSSALSGQPQMAEPLPIHALSDKPSPALSGQPMLMSRSLSGCTLSGQSSSAMVRLGSCLRRNRTHLRLRQCTRPRATHCIECMIIQVAARNQAQH
jgi:hypothetical protein